MSENNNKSKSIGGLYLNKSRNGLTYLSGFIEVNGERLKIVAFRNKEKISENTPDYQILPSTPYGSNAQSNVPAAQPKPKPQPVQEVDDSFDDEEIPF